MEGYTIFRVESYKRGAVFSSVLNLAGQGVGFLTNIVFAYYFGTSERADIYYYCLFVVSSISASLVVLDAAAIIPEAQRLRTQVGERACIGYLNTFLYAFLGLSVAVALGLLLQPIALFVRISSFDPALLLRHAPVVYWSIPLVITITLSQFLLDALMTFRFFTLPSFFGLVNRVVVLITVVAFHDSLSVVSALLGTLVTNVLLIGCCLVLMRRELGWDFGLVQARLDRRQWAHVGYCLAGQVASTLAAFAPYYLLGSAIGGTLSAMNYAQRIASMPYVLLGTQFMAVVSIKLNEQHARHDLEGLNRTLVRSANALSFVLIPIVCFMSVYARDIVHVLLQRGSFGTQSTDATSELLRYLVLCIPLMALTSISARLFMASQRMDLGLYCQIIGNVLLIAAMVVGVRLMGAVGYPVAQLLVGGVNLLLLALVNRRLFPYYRYGATLVYLLRIAGVGLAMAGLLWIVRRQTLTLGPAWCLGIGGLASGVAWWCINLVRPLNVEISSAIADRLRGMLRKES